MKKPKRLASLMERLKDGRLHSADSLAETLEVSVRTIYRDMDELTAAGIPIAGTRGQGYRALASITLPPLNLTETELEVLHLGLAAVGAGAAELPELAQAAQSLSAKIDALLPEEGHAMPFGFSGHPWRDAAQGFRHMPAFRAAIRARQKLRVTLEDGARHDIRPLKIDYWGRIWTCVAWSETAGDFVSIRLDTVAAQMPLPGLFVDEPGKRLDDYAAAPRP